MKKVFQQLYFTLLFSIVALAMTSNAAKAQPGYAISMQTFYDELSPYGQWIYDPNYGYVWAPDVDNSFRPYYSGGRWAYTQYGNTWISDYDWGWAPFHYGRWTYSPYYGWLWIPGTTWGPAWVSWRYGSGNYGWAPLGPGVGISISIGNWYAPIDWWCFTPQQYIYSGGYGNYWRGASYNQTIINNTTIVNNTTVINNNIYVYGPRREAVEQAIGQRVQVYNINNQSRPERSSITSNAVSIYRPEVRAMPQTSSESAVAPRSFTRVDRGVLAATPENENYLNRRQGAQQISNISDNQPRVYERSDADRYNYRGGRAQETPRQMSRPEQTYNNNQPADPWSRNENRLNDRNWNNRQLDRTQSYDQQSSPQRVRTPQQRMQQGDLTPAYAPQYQPRTERFREAEQRMNDMQRYQQSGFDRQPGYTAPAPQMSQTRTWPRAEDRATIPQSQPTIQREWRRPEPTNLPQPRQMNIERSQPVQRFEQSAPQRISQPMRQMEQPAQQRFERPQPAAPMNGNGFRERR